MNATIIFNIHGVSAMPKIIDSEVLRRASVIQQVEILRQNGRAQAEALANVLQDIKAQPTRVFGITKRTRLQSFHNNYRKYKSLHWPVSGAMTEKEFALYLQLLKSTIYTTRGVAA